MDGIFYSVFSNFQFSSSLYIAGASSFFAVSLTDSTSTLSLRCPKATSITSPIFT